MRLIKILVVILITFLITISGIWFYLTGRITAELNQKYAKKEFALSGIDKADYFVTFDRFISSSTPYKMAWKVTGWKEESKTATITYNFPLEFGYNFLSQHFFVSYSGDIISSYKPARQGFGARMLVENYNITASVPLSTEILKIFKDFKEPIAIINHVKDIKISTDRVEIFDLIDDEKFYDKEYERAVWSFVPAKNYQNLDDLLNHIPREYSINYTVKTKPCSAMIRRIPVSLFYGFSSLPAGLDLALNMEIKTKSETFKEFMKEVDIKASIDCKSDYLDLSNGNLLYKNKNHQQESSISTSFKILTKPGLFDRIFTAYGVYTPDLLKSPIGVFIHQEVGHIIRNKEIFKLAELEDSSYDFNLKMNSAITAGKKHLQIEDLNIQSESSGIRLQHEMESGSGASSERLINGVLYLTNYRNVIEQACRYIYRVGKFKFISDESRKIYASVNEKFLKDISDHPESTANDLSFIYNIDSKHPSNGKIGAVKIENLNKLYNLALYQKLFEIVGHEGDILAKMKEILPDLDENEPLLKNILARISSGRVDKIDKTDIDNRIGN